MSYAYSFDIANTHLYQRCKVWQL